MIFTGKAINGTFFPDSPSVLEQYLMENEGKKIKVEITRIFNRRSNGQNRYLWGVVYKMMAHRLSEMTGVVVSEEDVHYEFMHKFNYPTIIAEGRNGSTTLSKIISSSDMTTKQMMDYCQKLQQYSAVYLEIDIPDPNETISDMDGLQEIMKDE